MLSKNLIKTDISIFFVALIGLSLSLIAFFNVQQWEESQDLHEKSKQIDVYVRTLSQSFSTFGSILHSIRGLHSVYGSLSREHFSRFVRQVLSSQPGIQALEWIPFVPGSERLALEEQSREEGNPDFSFWELSAEGKRRTSPQHDFYYPVLFMESSSGNFDMLGYDLNSDPIFRSALSSARDQGQLTASGAVQMVTREGTVLGFRVFIPVYQANESSDQSNRTKHLVGFASGVFTFDNLLPSVLRLPKLRTDSFILLRDANKQSGQLLFAPSWYERMRTQVTETISVSIEFGGQQWHIVLCEINKGNEWFNSRYAWLVLAIGLLFTLGVSRHLYIIMTRVRWAEILVNKRTQSLLEVNCSLSHEIKTREQMAIALEESRQRFEAIFNEAPIGIVQTDLQGHILHCNKAFCALLDYLEEDICGKCLNSLSHPDDAVIDQTLLKSLVDNQCDNYTIGKRYRCREGDMVWTNQSSAIVRDASQHFIVSMIEDITERKCAEEARLQAEKKYRDIFENAIEGIFQCTPTGYFLSVNPAFVRIFGYKSAEQMLSEISNIGKQMFVDPIRREEFIDLLETYSEIKNFEYQAYCRDGRIIWVNETARAVRDPDGKIRYYEGTIEDVTERKFTEEKLLYDASHDQLTGLLNRSAFTKNLEKAIQSFRKTLKTPPTLPIPAEISIPFAVLFVDLDRFKIVNDSLGHLVGDVLLTQVSQRLQRETLDSDAVARFGGDEFALMLQNLPTLAVLEERVRLIQKQLTQPYVLKRETFNTTASIGVAMALPHYTSADEVLRDADTAMYEAKKSGRGRSVIFQPGMHTHVVNMLRLESDLRKALERDEFKLYYQPIISLSTWRTVSLEALVRWEHPERGLISPIEFIPLAEETGLIKELGAWVFKTACIQLRRWQTQFPEHADLGMNINVSPIQLKQPCLVQQIQEVLEKTGINAPTCRVEITEGAMMQDPETTLVVLHELKELNVLLYIDDFGTGYSSLSYLQKFPIDALKIDKSFIHELDTSSRAIQIAHAIIALGKAFNINVIAEGVENKSQINVLEAAHCYAVQGYFFSRPRDSRSMEDYLSMPIKPLGTNIIETYLR